MLNVHLAGFAPDYVPYLDGLALQRRVHAEIVAGNKEDTLILLEHTPVYTAGRRTSDAERPTDGSTVIDVDRGGKITWHGPGQLVGYPIVTLPDPIDVLAYVRTLENVLISVIRDEGVNAVRVEGRSGVWVQDDDGRSDEKIAAIGIRVAGGVTQHGFALNCSNDLDAFSHIIPCGISGANVTTLTRKSGKLRTPEYMIDAVTDAMSEAFDRQTAMIA